MAETLHHLGWCWNPINNGINYQPQLVQDFFHQPYLQKQGVLEDAGSQKKKPNSIHAALTWTLLESSVGDVGEYH